MSKNHLEHNLEHDEWRKENTLTSPPDRNLDQKFRLDQGAPKLTESQVEDALQTLSVKSFVERFPQVERRFVDPPLMNQNIGLISFVPAKGASPNEHGVYGFAKLRGNFVSEEDAESQAERIVRNVDSYHKIFHTYVGRPFPITISSDYSKEVSDVEMKQEMKTAFAEDIKKKREQEQKEIEDIKNREQELLADVKKTEEDAGDRYTTLMVKRAQLSWTYLETEKKLYQMVSLIARARREIKEMDEKDAVLRQNYYNKYLQARKAANLPTDRQSMDESFMKFLVEDAVIPAVDEEYRKLYESDSN